MEFKLDAIVITETSTGLEQGELTSANAIPIKNGFESGILVMNFGSGNLMISNKATAMIKTIEPTMILIIGLYAEKTAKDKEIETPKTLITNATPSTN